MKQVINKEDKAVSPIIATILLIAITVVLAATLVTILGGFTHGVSNTVETAGVTSKVVGTSSTAGVIYINVSSSSSAISASSITVSITGATFASTSVSGKTSGTLEAAAGIASGSSNATFTGGSSYIIPINTTSPSSVSVELIYKGNVIYNSASS